MVIGWFNELQMAALPYQPIHSGLPHESVGFHTEVRMKGWWACKGPLPQTWLKCGDLPRSTHNTKDILCNN